MYIYIYLCVCVCVCVCVCGVCVLSSKQCALPIITGYYHPSYHKYMLIFTSSYFYNRFNL